MAAMQMQASAMKACFLIAECSFASVFKKPQLPILYLYIYNIPYYRAKIGFVTIRQPTC